jgi:hypothetical protein
MEYIIFSTCSQETTIMSCAEQVLLLVSCLAYSYTLNMEATCSSETCFGFHRTTGRYALEERSPQLQRS